MVIVDQKNMCVDVIVDYVLQSGMELDYGWKKIGDIVAQFLNDDMGPLL